MSAPEPTSPETTPAQPSLELLWQDDATAYAFIRSVDGTLSSGHLHIGMPAVADLTHLGHGTTARRVALRELIELSDEHGLPAGVELGGSTQATFPSIRVARASVAEGLVHPQLQHGGGAWLAFWGATLDETVQDEPQNRGRSARGVCGRIRR